MKKYFLALGPLVATMMGCGSGDDTRGNTYTVFVSPDFGDNTAEVISVLEYWETSVSVLNNHLSLDIIISDIDCSSGNCERAFSIAPKTIAYINSNSVVCSEHPVAPGAYCVGDTEQYQHTDAASVWVGSDITDPTERHQTMIHEIGHALGLVHTGSGTIMCAEIDCEATEITCEDIKQYAVLRNEEPPNCDKIN